MSPLGPGSSLRSGGDDKGCHKAALAAGSPIKSTLTPWPPPTHAKHAFGMTAAIQGNKSEQCRKQLWMAGQARP